MGWGQVVKAANTESLPPSLPTDKTCVGLRNVLEQAFKIGGIGIHPQLVMYIGHAPISVHRPSHGYPLQEVLAWGTTVGPANRSRIGICHTCVLYIYIYIYVYIYIDRCRDSSFIQQFLVCSVEFYKGVDGAPNHLGPGMGHICLGLSGAAAWGCLTLPGAT